MGDIRRIGTTSDILGEGPVWCPVAQALWWVDIKAPAVRRWTQATDTVDSWPMPDSVGSLAVAADGRVLVALRDRVVIDFQKGWPNTRAEMDIRLTDQTTVHAGHDAGIPAADVAEQGGRLEAKFAGLVSPLLGEARTAALIDEVAGIDRRENVAGLI